MISLASTLGQSRRLDQCQAMERHGGYVYVISTAFGRNKPGGMILRRVPEAQILTPPTTKGGDGPSRACRQRRSMSAALAIPTPSRMV
ncbi:MAG: hypothetical protein U5O16_40430 [Rhodococcus sp. (in: high G+C Gram-positive bacteria)]|uniref:hypothetical protein n=1 Tax=Rhodococcus sp. TaxID=1831 RepID=UPI002AD698D2|nr:hypothetical protein [Rhodococcus sp. (in: high G+C Gram-positive bacteria)]